MKVGVRCGYYGSDFWQRLLASIAVGQIELAFRYVEDFLALADPINVASSASGVLLPFALRSKVTEPIKALELKVPSLHMAHAKVNKIGRKDGEFLSVFFETLPIMLELGAKLLIVHPRNGKASKIGTLVDDYLAEVLETFKITLCWETFSGRQRFIGPVETIARFVEDRSFQAICYDTAHVGESTEKVLADIEDYGTLVKVWHLANWNKRKRHLPLFHPKGVLNFEPIIEAIQQYSPDSVVTLEGYLLSFQHLLLRDVLRMRKIMSS